MSHSTVSTKKTRFTLVKQVQKLRVTLHACKRKRFCKSERKMCICAKVIKRGSVYVGLSSSTKSPVDSYLCVYVMEALLEVIKWGAPRDVAMCVYARELKPRYGCVSARVCLSSSLSNRQLFVCVSVYMHINTTERLQLHQADILLLIMKYFVSKSLVFPYKNTLQPSQ